MDTTCRTCSRHDAFEGVSLESLSTRHQEPLYLMLIYCTQLQISPTDSLPQQICPNCLIMLDRAYTFWEQCRHSDATLRWGPAPSEEQPEEPVVEETPQSYWCCVRKCTTVTKSLDEMEAHAKEAHCSKRIMYELQRKPEHEFICSVCRAGFEDFGKFEYHRMIQLGLREKKEVSNEGFRTVVEEEESQMSQSMRDVLDGIINDLKAKFEAKAETTKEDFMIFLRRKDYETVCSSKVTRAIFRKRFYTFAQKICQKAVRLVQICNKCRFETNFSKDMQRHVEQEVCRNASCSYGLKTYVPATSTFKCIQCGHEAARKDALLRHQRNDGHEGIEVIKATKPIPPPDGDSDSIAVKNEPPPSSDEEEPPLEVLPEEFHFDCSHCGMALITEEDKQRHLLLECPVLHNKTHRYTCEHCQVVSTKTVKGLQKHMRSECPVFRGKPRSSRKFIPKICPKCGRSFNTTEGLIRHSMFCSMNQPGEAIPCPNCQRVFTKKFSLERHLSLQTCGKLLNSCKHCRGTFPTKLALKRHKQLGCPALLTQAQFKATCSCPRCGKAFASKQLLRRHTIVDWCRDESELRPSAKPGKFQCPHCRTQLARAKSLKRHLEQTCLVLLQRQAEAQTHESTSVEVGGCEELYGMN